MTATTYRAYGVVVRSELSLPAPLCEDGRVADVRCLRGVGSPPEATGEWLTRSEEPWPFALGRCGEDYLLTYSGLADYAVTADGRQITAWVGDANAGSAAALLLDNVLPRALSLGGRLVLHASGVVMNGVAVGFVGDSGVGKSTIAAGLAARGHAHLTDDALLVRERAHGWEAVPSYPTSRLWPVVAEAFGDARSGEQKRRIGPGGALCFGAKSAPLQRLYFLGEPGGALQATIRPANARQAIVELARQAFRLNVTDREQMRAELERFESLTGSCRRLDYPRALTAFPGVERAILSDLSDAR